MVDLVKIRKKAKKAKETEAVPPSAEAAVPPVAAAAEPPLEVAALPEAAVPGIEAPGPSQPLAEPGIEVRQTKLDRFKEQAGRRRETDAAQAQDEETVDAGRVELLTFAIAGEQYAVDIERIVEIVTPRAMTRVPNADASIVGIISLRGTIVTLVDVRGKLRHPPAGEPTADTRIVVVDFHNETVGFLVDRVLRVVKADAGEIEPHPVVHATELDESVRGVFRIGDALTILLDLEKLLDHTALAGSL
jgi:purine-binding chemotaxis protein CheW